MTTESSRKQYSGPLFISLIVHGVIFVVFFLGLQFSSNKPPVPFQTVNVVKAVTVNQAQVEQEISKIQEQKQKEEQEKLAQKEEMQQKLEEFKQKQKQEQAKLEKLKQNLKQQQEKQIAEQKAQEKKLADLKEQQTKEAERLTKIKQEQAQAQKLKEQQKLAEKEKPPEKVAEKSPTKTKNKKALDDLLKDIQKEDAEKEAASSKKKSLKDLAKNQKQEKDDLEELVSSAEMQGEVDKYKSLILRAIGQRWRIPENADPSLACKLLIKLGPGGVVLDVKVVESSGDTLLDRSAVLAVQKASPLPVPEAKDVFNKFREFKLTVRPESILSSA